MANTKSLWIDTAPAHAFPTLDRDVQADVAVVGGGIAGILAAWQLAQSGKRVVVLEANRVCRGVTGYTTAKVTSAHGVIYESLGDNAGIYAEANEWGVAWIGQQAAMAGIECDLARKSMYVFAENGEERETLQREFEAIQGTDLAAVWVHQPDLPIPALGAIHYVNQIQFHPNKFVQGLAERLLTLNGEVFENTRVREVEEGEPCRIVTDRGIVTAAKVVIASHFPVYDPAMFFSRLAPYRDYAVAARIRGALPQSMSIGAGENGYAFRTQDDLLIVSGESHKVGQADSNACFANLEAYVRKHFDVESIPYRWSTQDNKTLDQMPYIGRISGTSDHAFIITGFGGWGMSTAAFAGRIVADLVAERDNPWAETFDPNRWKGIEGVKTFVKENVNVAKHFVGDKVAHAEDGSPQQLLPGDAAIFRVNGEKVAAYRDLSARLHVVSPICTHMGCDLAWNAAETSWDCPCHGSRFDYEGNVIQGPAVENLERKEILED
ncbi:MAG: FAD-dependent oxidoreductase [Fimbriimonas sp.]